MGTSRIVKNTLSSLQSTVWSKLISSQFRGMSVCPLQESMAGCRMESDNVVSQNNPSIFDLPFGR